MKYYRPFFNRTSIVLYTTCWLLSACSDDAAKFGGEYKKYQGIWQSDAYGQVMQIAGDTIINYQNTFDQCIRVSTQNNVTLQQFEQRFSFKGEQLFAFNYPQVKDVDESGVTMQPVKALPYSCKSNLIAIKGDKNYQQDAERDARFWFDDFSEHYVDFELSATDWQLTQQHILSQINPQTSDSEFFEFLAVAMAGLKNGHLGLYDGSITYQVKRADKPDLFEKLSQEYLQEVDLQPPLTEEQKQQQAQYVADNLALIEGIIGYYSNDMSQIKTAAQGNLVWFKTADLAYLNIMGLSEFASASDLSTQLSVADTALKEVIESMQDTSGMIIDLRFNGGGYPFLAKKIAGYFTDVSYVAYTEQTKGLGGFSDKVEVNVEPQALYYEKPIVVLVSNTTASAAELLALMLRARGNVTFIGEPTQGMLSGSLGRTLPNGWLYSVSNLKRLTPDGDWFEYSGIPVSRQTTFFSKEERAGFYDQAIDAARLSLTRNL
ncbi:S41 family peptidase [Neptunicella marina]|uniref:S41 family peptidase n=1 Tax=Neptunicella marina TaxID=2125989 RepID=A0A8J6IZ76_9ALTE|nr:S41 family peptidase [Neptunicella marina]MBC3767562.1 S41 family peptidase [Neptunicella marina]